MPKPTTFPDWATEAVVDAVSGTTNKIEPNPELKSEGLKYREPMARQYQNYQFDLIAKWIRHFDEITSGVGSLVLESAYPVGSVHLSTNNANPASYFGFGVWTAISQGRALFGVDTGDADFNTVKKTGGAKTHNHSGTTGGTSLTVAQMPEHTHTTSIPVYTGGGGGTVGVDKNPTADGTASFTSAAQGDGDPHTHVIPSNSSLPPYLTLYVWERVS